ncbi:MAG: type II toxin-antitoxin system mRNA interferase toxin, RelE/StbE family [bacterium]|nr:type II toxin-antitoxin system mRNA interferase toxin, RelE/StbE family [bacterium]MBU1918325.1 type II toxin-antitoxin system mRNA interferase toxin, RelE/StbE family [bacterium]
MGKYKIHFTRTAQKSLNKISKQIIPKILSAISGLSFDPFPKGSRKLTGFSSIFRIRVQNYRIIYEIIDNEIIIKILKIGHRKDIYR